VEWSCFCPKGILGQVQLLYHPSAEPYEAIKQAQPNPLTSAAVGCGVDEALNRTCQKSVSHIGKNRASDFKSETQRPMFALFLSEKEFLTQFQLLYRRFQIRALESTSPWSHSALELVAPPSLQTFVEKQSSTFEFVTSKAKLGVQCR
jgi:hypothetical protein